MSAGQINRYKIQLLLSTLSTEQVNGVTHDITYQQALDPIGSVSIVGGQNIVAPGQAVDFTLTGLQASTGIQFDSNSGTYWFAYLDSNNAQRIDPTAGPIGGGGFPVGAVDLTVSLGAGASPYNYSDMTWFVSIGSTSPSGSWTTVYDGGEADFVWDYVSWNSNEPAGTGVGVEVCTDRMPL